MQPFTKRQKRLEKTRRQRHNKEQLEKKMQKNNEDVLILIGGFLAELKESQALQREEREGGSNA